MIKKILVIVIFMFVTCSIVPHLHAAKWKGQWYLRAKDKCIEITLDRKGRSVPTSSPKVIVEKVDGVTYLTVYKFQEKHSYKMTKTDENIYFLQVVSVGPNQDLKTLATEDSYFGMYRKIVECQLASEE